ncbi:MAG: hypothetical protein JWQ38_3766 [Flavipsychrobacter sp.]|nr:hypothetical protein [Flavipsychrobacter sp.]
MENTIFHNQLFKHYKGNLYQFLYVATHSETLEEAVVYRALYGDKGVWVRPKEMFFGTVTVDGVEVLRFAPQGNS